MEMIVDWINNKILNKPMSFSPTTLSTAQELNNSALEYDYQVGVSSKSAE